MITFIKSNFFIFYTIIRRLTLFLIAICIFSSSELFSMDLRKKKNLYGGSPVLRINTSGNSGSGVVIGKKNNLYSLITARHVVDSSLLEEIEILISENVYANASRIFDPFPNKDLVIIQFKHFGDIELALMPYLDQTFWNKITSWPAIKVEGIANPSDAVPEPTRRKIYGTIINLLQEHIDGYNLIHNANTTVGMSGGAIFGMPQSSDMAYLKKDLNSKSNFFESSTQDEVNNLRNKRYNLVTKYRLSSYFHDFDNVISEISKSNLLNDQEKKIFSMCLLGTFEKQNLIKVNEKNKKIIEQLLNPRLEENSEKVIDCFRSTLNLTDTYQEYGNLVTDNIEFCAISTYRLKNLLLAIHGRSEAYAYGGKSGTGIGIFLGQEEVIEWFNLNGRQLGIPLTDGSNILDLICKNKDKYYQKSF